MSRLLSVSLTEDAVVERRKTVTRRLGWWEDKNGRRLVKPGDRLTLCRKVMGRKRPDGTVDPLVRLAEVEVIDVRREALHFISHDDIAREGVSEDLWMFDPYGSLTNQWALWFAASMGCDPDAFVTRIEWRYLDEVPS